MSLIFRNYFDEQHYLSFRLRLRFFDLAELAPQSHILFWIIGHILGSVNFSPNESLILSYLPIKSNSSSGQITMT